MCLAKKLFNTFLMLKKILNDILKGRGQFASEWFLVILRLEDKIEWVLKPINEVINFYGGKVVFSPQGSLKIGRLLCKERVAMAAEKVQKCCNLRLIPCCLCKHKQPNQHCIE